MKKYKVVIIDDEEPARELLLEYLQHFPFFHCVESCRDGFEGLKAIQLHKPDLVFLDVQMPRINGLEMLELLDTEAEPMPQIIFTTAYDEYALKAFDYNTIDYLLKPISQDRFSSAIKKVTGFMGRPDGNAALNTARAILSGFPDGSLERIVVRSGTDIHIIPDHDIFCLEARDDYVLVCTEKQEFLKRKTLGFYERMLDPGLFVRVHRSYIARMDAISRIEPYSKDAYVAILKNGRKISVSKKGYAALKELLGI